MKLPTIRLNLIHNTDQGLLRWLKVNEKFQKLSFTVIAENKMLF